MKSILIIAASLAAAITSVSAHAFIDESDPRVGSTVRKAPRELSICFTEPIALRSSNVEVTDAGSKRVDKKDAHMEEPRLLVLALQPLKPGEYTVRWHVTAEDGHATSGSFKFTVAK